MAKKLQIVSGRPFQADWNITDEDNMAYIRNKPNLSDMVRMKSAVLYVDSWNEENPYYQQIQLDVTPNSKIDIQSSVDIAASIFADNLHLLIKNDNGVVTVYSINGKPSIDLNLQLMITEVAKENDLDVIWGNMI